jgi:hypothetical protein
VGPSGIGTTGHEGRTVSGTLLTTRDTGTDKEQALLLELVSSSDRVGVVRVSTINDDISLLEERLELTDKVVNGLTGLDEENDSPGLGELAAELLDRVGTNNVGSCMSAFPRNQAGASLPLASFSRKASTLEVVLFCQHLLRS